MSNSGDAIFVGIASYCDTELDETLTQLFGKAKDPSRVYVGLVLQEHEAVRQAPVMDKWRRHPRVRMLEFDPIDSKGAGWARSNIARLHRGEAYYLQLDSHHIFVRWWDATCVSVLANVAKKSPKPMLTSYVRNYPANVTNAESLLSELPWRMTTGHWMNPFSGLTPKKIQYIPAPIETHIMHAISPEPQPAAFFSAHFVFVRSSWLREVPYDPYVYFDGEEDSLGLRSWTSGYDMFYPTTHIVFHRYHRADSKKHWDDHPKMFNDMTIASIKRLNDIIATGGGPNGSDRLGKFGLGKARTLTQYQDFAGVNYDRMWLTTRARYGEIGGRVPTRSTPRLWVHSEGHFQIHKFEEWGEVWEEWKWTKQAAADKKTKKKGGGSGGVGGGKEQAAAAAAAGDDEMMAKVEAKFIVTSRDRAPPRPNLHMKDESRGIELNLTPEACFYRYPNRNDSLANWTLMTYGYWM